MYISPSVWLQAIKTASILHNKTNVPQWRFNINVFPWYIASVCTLLQQCHFMSVVKASSNITHCHLRADSILWTTRCKLIPVHNWIIDFHIKELQIILETFVFVDFHFTKEYSSRSQTSQNVSSPVFWLAMRSCWRIHRRWCWDCCENWISHKRNCLCTLWCWSWTRWGSLPQRWSQL